MRVVWGDARWAGTGSWNNHGHIRISASLEDTEKHAEQIEAIGMVMEGAAIVAAWLQNRIQEKSPIQQPP